MTFLAKVCLSDLLHFSKYHCGDLVRCLLTRMSTMLCSKNGKLTNVNNSPFCAPSYATWMASLPAVLATVNGQCFISRQVQMVFLRLEWNNLLRYHRYWKRVRVKKNHKQKENARECCRNTGSDPPTNANNRIFTFFSESCAPMMGHIYK